MKEIENILLKSIETALCGHWRYFEVKPADILVNEDNVYSQIFSFKPLDQDFEDSKLVGETHFLEIMAEDNGEDEGFHPFKEEIEISLIVGEDNQLSLTLGSIYSALYWSEVLKPI